MLLNTIAEALAFSWGGGPGVQGSLAGEGDAFGDEGGSSI